jgi:cell division protein FtsB
MFVRKIEVDKEINKLKAQADRIQKDTDDLSSLIKYLNTPEYAEREAREKLNLKKEGEFVVVLQTQENVAGANAGLEKEPSNPQKWLEYFFKP